ncbi:pilin N-terminal domain-containing protein [Lacticaseibacillus porcinae]|uniref:pilin N-terminal domain-containing protein n=1 Tax=Lacticaseibacillus porcinae TaxID=1123687 RepID=UPI000F7AD151|nr:pilin N-terminal domain-containing protein [Lacticaseibacillus porcinae]
MRKLIAFLSLMAFALIAFGNQRVHASADTTTLTLHKRIYRDARLAGLDNWEYNNQGQAIIQTDESFGLNGANFDVYDATELYDKAHEDGESEQDFAKRLAGLDCKSGSALAKAYDLPLVTTLKTGTVNGEDGVVSLDVPNISADQNAAYLLIETSVDADILLNVDLTKKAAPIYLRLGTKDRMDVIHLYPKNVGYVRDPYFFKFGRQLDGSEKRLKGVTFALYRIEPNGEKLYLDNTPVFDLKNSWITTTDPLNHPQVAKFVSDDNGLVDSGERFLPAGTYYFEELASVAGYSSEIKDVEVIIPATWYDDAGNYLSVTVNGEVMEETLSGVVKESSIQAGRPRVYNNQVGTAQPTTPSKPSTNKPSTILPAMGTAISWLAVLIGAVFMIAAINWMKKNRSL